MNQVPAYRSLNWHDPCITIKCSELGFCYYYSNKNWMTGAIFKYICMVIDSQARNLNRKFLILLDNAPCHNTTASYINLGFLYLPPNTTSYLQPLDASIIQNFKVKYQNYQYTLGTGRYISEKIDNPDNLSKLTQLESMKFILRA
ncbi:hypothetical protein PHYBLDRAFT_70247 [Phycomyces blakesleeanus NRRL 1555(-)]|uniref:DDE-1 domain-containing protein n=1 Tax=Phycomyces blakesleeanus (strain ATCC 8743b / DSM 1359 / FGSC 10004 / NBRC 33097 / NRRL 1555) TaxID=763407 RepID=A0A162TFN9_PHYB8|nr:hypothetical protein PHYBLDRAFT_70247 [Phycomyces blakesleeanus NRRL 1555(-)]OAD66763.1 hypothetical protein PHYBLDRAFT_70247 [Phycomyces blakesleeanus NRRL 1555(-)]|eukprot:XP_018284803.1 hypothetical protein PHYBLDRAFT_70247 [Phycomyces blakesleeanus NRRL 1555(-)]